MKAKYLLYMAGVVVSVGAAAIPVPIRGWVGSSPVVLAEAADKTPAATRPTQSKPPATKPPTTLRRTAVPTVLTPVEVKAPASQAESASVPKGPTTSKQPGAGAVKDGISLERPIDGLPARRAPGAPPASSTSKLVGAAEIPLDPSVRPDLANLSGSRLDDYSKGVTGTDATSDITNLRPQTGSRLNGFKAGVFGSAEKAGVKDTPGRDPVSMFGQAAGGGTGTKEKGAAGTAMAPIGYDDEGVHAGGKSAVKEAYGDTAIGKAGAAIGNGLPGTNAGQALKQAVDEIDSNGNSSTSGSTGNGSASSSGTSNCIGPKCKSKDGGVEKFTYSDGTVEIINHETGTTTTLKTDGSTKTTKTETGETIDESKPSTKMPDPDHRVVLPDAVKDMIDADKEKLRGIGPKRGNGAVDFGEGDTVAKDGAVRLGALPDKQQGLINPGSAGATTSPPPSVNQTAPPTGADPNNTDPTED